MKITKILCIASVCFLFLSCSQNKWEEKGFAVSSSEENDESTTTGIVKDSLLFETKPSGVLLTGHSQYRLTSIYKVSYSYDKRGEKATAFVGSNHFHQHYYYENEAENGNCWNHHLFPGLETVSGYNMVNVSHYDIDSNVQKYLFKEPVLVKTLYYPSFSVDTLNYKPVLRNYILVSCYDEDTDKDGYINIRDLRRFYYFDIKGGNKKSLLSENYSVYKSEYDSGNDYMYVFARLDENKNGKIDENEPIHIFWIDLKNPNNTGRLY